MSEPAQVQREWLENLQWLINRVEVVAIQHARHEAPLSKLHDARNECFAALQAYPAQHPATGEPAAWRSDDHDSPHVALTRDGLGLLGQRYGYPLYRAAAPSVEDAAQDIARLRTALQTSMVAIDDWLSLYASEECDPERVAEAADRVAQHGTLGYIATVQAANRAALASPPPAQEPT